MTRKITFLSAFSALLMLVAATAATAQTGKIAGKVIDSKTSETLVGVAVMLQGTAAPTGAVTDFDGNYIIENISAGTYKVRASYVGYDTKEISEIVVKANETVNLDISLGEATSVMTEVVVTATRKQEAVNTILVLQKNSITVSDGISGDAIRRSPDKNTSEVIRRVSGISIQDNRFPIVRGLSDRYNVALVNGVVLPSTEPDRKAFSFDLFPSALIDNIIVNKAATPDLPADFAGGVIQLNTKDIPTENFTNLQISFGVNSQTHGQRYLTSLQGSNLDLLGLGAKDRELPSDFPSASTFVNAPTAQQIEYSKRMTNDWGVKEITALPNTSIQISRGFTKTFSNRQVFGGMVAVTYNRSMRNIEFRRAEYLGASTDTLKSISDNRYTTNNLNGVLVNLAYKLNDFNRISFKNTLNVNTDDITTDRTGTGYDGATNYFKSTLIRYRSNRLLTSQLSGEHRLTEGGIRLKWTGAVNVINRDLPNQRQLGYARPEGSTEADFRAAVGSNVNPFGTGKLYSNLVEKTYLGNADLTVPFKALGQAQNLRVGVNYQYRTRDFAARALGMLAGRNIGAQAYLPDNQIFDAANIGQGLFYYGELTDDTYRYKAQTSTFAPYIMFDTKINNKLRLVWGARLENYPLVLESSQKKDTTFRNILPSLNLTYALNDKSNLRLSASQTLARPELRELAPFSFYDFELNRIRTGNPNLQQTTITNLDLRYEIFPEGGQVFSVSAFYKNFQNPIEETYNSTGVGTYITNIVNAKSATSYGAELEFRKNLGFLAPKSRFMADVTAFSNLAYIISDVTFAAQSLNRALQGQSPYIVNVGLQYSNIDNGWGGTVLFNQIGRRIFEVGDDENPTIYEAPRPLLDLQLSKRFAKTELRLNVSDVFNARYQFYQDLNKNGKFDPKTDGLFMSQRQGTTVNVTFAYKL